MQTIDDKIDNAVHAAFMAMGLSVENNVNFAMMLNEWLYQHAPQYITDDIEDE